MGKLKYKLLKDLSELKAGSTFVEVDTKDIENLKLIYQIDDGGVPRCAYTWINPEKLNEWFEEIKEPVDSIHWKPKTGERYWFYFSDGGITSYPWDDDPEDVGRYRLGRVYRTEEECVRARNRELAEVRLRRTSTFEPDFENANGGWTVYYSYNDKKLNRFFAGFNNSGEPVYYETAEEAEKSIKENEQDWKIYFGIEDKN